MVNYPFSTFLCVPVRKLPGASSRTEVSVDARSDRDAAIQACITNRWASCRVWRFRIGTTQEDHYPAKVTYSNTGRVLARTPAIPKSPRVDA
jgi:hypothetical protein